MKIGVLGGTFNPIHNGHLRAAAEAYELMGLDEVLFIPAGTPPLKSRDIAPARPRLEMVRLAVGSDPRFKVLDIEIERTGPDIKSDTQPETQTNTQTNTQTDKPSGLPSYTINTLRQLQDIYEGAELVFVLGLDAFVDLPKWKDFKEIASLWDLAVLCRPPFAPDTLLGMDLLEIDPQAVASLKAGEVNSIEARVKGALKRAWIIGADLLEISASDIRERIATGRSFGSLLPEGVESYIITSGLYGYDISK